MATYDDPKQRIDALVATTDLLFRRRFNEIISSVRDRAKLDEIATLLENGQLDEALVEADIAANHLANAYTFAYVLAAQQTAQFLADTLDVVISFDQTNYLAVNQMRQNQLRLIREFTQEQRLTTRTALLDGIAEGLNPREQALLFRDTIGLTRRQLAAIDNYRTLLESNSAEALDRELRDGRYDRSVEMALRDGEAVPAARVDAMVERYRQNMLTFRAEGIAQTESLASVHEGVDEMYRQAAENGTFDPTDLTQTWHTAGDNRVRDSHDSMDGQEQPIGTPFTSGLGNSLAYPGDPSAPAEDRIRCRCAKTTRFSIDT